MKKELTFSIEENIYRKLFYIALQNGRTEREQLNKWIEDSIKAFEGEYGEIKLSKASIPSLE